jgi:predicted transcriptional regulator
VKKNPAARAIRQRSAAGLKQKELAVSGRPGSLIIIAILKRRDWTPRRRCTPGGKGRKIDIYEKTT